MRTPLDDLADADVAAALAEGWGIEVVSLAYAPVGFGSHHWVTEPPWFVTVDEPTERWSFQNLTAAFTTARALRDDADLPFVVAPIPSVDGTVVRRLAEQYAISVFPFLDVVGEESWGGFTSPAHRTAALDMVVAVHRATLAAEGHARRDDLALPDRAALEAALADTGRTWDGGPYGERARQRLVAHAAGVERLLVAYDRLAGEVGDGAGWVLTHGEPHPGNVVETTTGWVLVDWDTALVAPPERDLWHLGDGAGYEERTGTRVRPEALDLYRLQWDLGEIAVYTERFRRSHGESADDTLSFHGLCEYLDPEARWPALF